MLVTRALATAVVLASTATAFFPWFPDYLCVEDHTCVAERAVEDHGVVAATLKLVQRIPQVAISWHALLSITNIFN